MFVIAYVKNGTTFFCIMNNFVILLWVLHVGPHRMIPYVK